MTSEASPVPCHQGLPACGQGQLMPLKIAGACSLNLPREPGEASLVCEPSFHPHVLLVERSPEPSGHHRHSRGVLTCRERGLFGADHVRGIGGRHPT